MKQWEQNGIAGVFSLAIGIVLMMWGFQAADPIDLDITLPTVTATLDPTFIVLFMMGMLLIGCGIGFLGSTRTIYKLEKQLPPP